MAELCAIAIENNIETGYATMLIKKRGLMPATPPVEVENWPWPVRVYTFGRFGIVKNGELIKFPRRAQQKPVEFLKTLIAFGGRDVSEAQLVDVLWPETDGDSAHRAFDTTLHRLS